MKIIRCRICGETYLGAHEPTRCPFCGAHERFMVDTVAYSSPTAGVQPTEIERADLDTAIEIERSNARFYAAMATNPGNDALASAYKRLSRIEAEHCSIFCKLADEVKPEDLSEPSEASGDWTVDIAESRARENTAAAFYAEASARATDPRIREILAAVSEVERDHIELDDIAAKMAAGQPG